jgi:cytochrome c2
VLLTFSPPLNTLDMLSTRSAAGAAVSSALQQAQAVASAAAVVAASPARRAASASPASVAAGGSRISSECAVCARSHPDRVHCGSGALLTEVLARVVPAVHAFSYAQDRGAVTTGRVHFVNVDMSHVQDAYYFDFPKRLAKNFLAPTISGLSMSGKASVEGMPVKVPPPAAASAKPKSSSPSVDDQF